MANPNGNPKNLTSWQEGQSGNPAGRPKNPPELTMIRNLKRRDLAIVFNKILSASPKELEQFDSTVLEKWLAHTVKRGMDVGNVGLLFNLLDRLFGKDMPYLQEQPERNISEMSLIEKKNLLEHCREELVRLESDIKDEEAQIEI